jgi:ERF superfamily
MADTKASILERLSAVQTALKVPKGQRNTFGNYNFRNAEDILEAVKPLLAEHGLILTLSDELVQVGDRYYVKATGSVHMPDSTSYSVAGYAREEETKKGMDGSQITGASSSYARKYALNGFFDL